MPESGMSAENSPPADSALPEAAEDVVAAVTRRPVNRFERGRSGLLLHVRHLGRHPFCEVEIRVRGSGWRPVGLSPELELAPGGTVEVRLGAGVYFVRGRGCAGRHSPEARVVLAGGGEQQVELIDAGYVAIEPPRRARSDAGTGVAARGSEGQEARAVADAPDRRPIGPVYAALTFSGVAHFALVNGVGSFAGVATRFSAIAGIGAEGDRPTGGVAGVLALSWTSPGGGGNRFADYWMLTGGIGAGITHVSVGWSSWLGGAFAASAEMNYQDIPWLTISAGVDLLTRPDVGATQLSLHVGIGIGT